MKPVLFNTEMVKAILVGRKTVTRRLIKGIPSDAQMVGTLIDSTIQGDTKNIGKLWYKVHEPDITMNVYTKFPYEIGDILYVRETWCKNGGAYLYKAGCPHLQDNMWIKWHTSIHMPKEAARIFLRVKEVRVERLWDITETQAKAEGVITNDAVKVSSYRYWFEQLWNSTIDMKNHWMDYSWSANPWVWVIEFERISKEEATNG